MAKFAEVTYGTHGDTKAYTYVVNDNVRTGDFIHPTVKHKISGKIFGTTGIVQSSSKTTSVTGIQKQQELDSKGIKAVRAYTGEEVGAQHGLTAQGSFEQSGLRKTVKDKITGIRSASEGSQFQETQYIRQTRQGNIQRRQESYDEYAKKYEGEQ